ncbi:scavenger receptor cysteine-rich domain-containing group B protein isoform X4 [Sturnira hondurensis]|uniref:scavenger receptor cysteine-rich domain-containing group B protein isoform X4 n=1 Tax=Sturnira hondurensis TaxID=192404 RepID=UPI001879FA28|nr:scavenger receptor cysteine-rich domain-containing group B protein isoform X4 [Sturnira hondurensis]
MMEPSERPLTGWTHQEAEIRIGPQIDQSRGWRPGDRSTALVPIPPALSFLLLLPLEFLPTQRPTKKVFTTMVPPTTPRNGNGEGSVRLVGGAGPCQGRVEILHSGLWGTVCDDDWGLPDATVVCRQLGCGEALAATTNAFFGYGTGHIMLDNVHCEGSEPRLAACLSLGWGVHNCGHHEDAGAICAVLGPPTLTALPSSATREDWAWHTEPEERQHCSPLPPGPRGRKVSGRAGIPWWVGKDRPGAPPGSRWLQPSPSGRGSVRPAGGRLRLVGGPGPCRGRVEVMYAGGWGTVCDDDWDFADARVACREAGCGPALGATGLGHFGYGRGPVLLDNVGCAGTEARLSDCFHLGWGQHNCGHHEDAGALCSGPEELGLHVPQDGSETTRVPTPRPRDGHLRLANGAHRCEGRVELFLGQRWGTVCDDAWDLRAAGVLCHQLGCGQALAAPGEAHFGPGRGPILLDNVKCRGDESALLLCSHIRWDAHNCDHSEDASVLCQPL